MYEVVPKRRPAVAVAGEIFENNSYICGTHTTVFDTKLFVSAQHAVIT